MARVTVEDCVEKVEDRFELVVLAAERAKKINSGAHITLDRENDKDAVVALREIAAGNMDIPALRTAVIARLQNKVSIDAPEEDADIHSVMEEDMAYVPASEEFNSDDEMDLSDLEMDVGSFDDITEDEIDIEQ